MWGKSPFLVARTPEPLFLENNTEQSSTTTKDGRSYTTNNNFDCSAKNKPGSNDASKMAKSIRQSPF
jgi:hypothetical protein